MRLIPIRTACATVAIALTLAACAPTTQRPAVDAAASEAEAKLQRAMAFLATETQRHRLNVVAQRILVAGADLCGDKTRWSIGLTLTNVAMFEGPTRRAAEERGYDDLSRVSGLAPGGPAEAAGIEAGDVLVRIGDGPDLPRGKEGMAAVDAALAKATDAPLPVRVRRKSEHHDVVVRPVKACAYPVLLQQNAQINAFADGTRIVMYTGMARFAAADEELALIVGHELAHNIRDHRSSKMGNAILGILLDAVIAGLTGVNTGVFGQAAANANSPAFEAEADYVGLYFLARAGYAIDDAPNFWRRMAVENPQAISHTSTHPATNDRFVALQAAIAEIKGKIEAGQPLVPNEAPKAPPAQPQEPNTR